MAKFPMFLEAGTSDGLLIPGNAVKGGYFVTVSAPTKNTDDDYYTFTDGQIPSGVTVGTLIYCSALKGFFQVTSSISNNKITCTKVFEKDKPINPDVEIFNDTLIINRLNDNLYNVLIKYNLTSEVKYITKLVIRPGVDANSYIYYSPYNTTEDGLYLKLLCSRSTTSSSFMTVRSINDYGLENLGYVSNIINDPLKNIINLTNLETKLGKFPTKFRINSNKDGTPYPNSDVFVKISEEFYINCKEFFNDDWLDKDNIILLLV